MFHVQEPSGPLKGVVIAVAKKLSSRQSEFNNMVSELGGDYRWTYDPSVTHYIFQVLFLLLSFAFVQAASVFEACAAKMILL